MNLFVLDQSLFLFECKVDSESKNKLNGSSKCQSELFKLEDFKKNV